MNNFNFWSIIFGLWLIMLWLPLFGFILFFLSYGRINETKYGNVLYYYKKPDSLTKLLIFAIFVFIIVLVEFPTFIKYLNEGIFLGFFILSINIFTIFSVLSWILGSEDLREYFITNDGFLINHIPISVDWRGRRNIIMGKNYTSKFIPFSKISSLKIDTDQEEIKINANPGDLSHTFKYNKEDLGRIQSILKEKGLTFI